MFQEPRNIQVHICVCYLLPYNIKNMSEKDDQRPSTSTQEPTNARNATDWELCILCQRVTSDSLQSPIRWSKNTCSSDYAGYISLAEDLLRFNTLQHIPLDLDLRRLDEGIGIERTLSVRQAKWHKKCRLKFNKKAFGELSRKEIASQPSTSHVKTRSTNSHLESTDPLCFFCDEPAGSLDLRKASTKNIDANVRRCAIELEDSSLLTKLAAGDMIAIEAQYHLKCLSSLYKKAKSKLAMDESDDVDDARLHGIAFAELVAHLDEIKKKKSTSPVKLAELAKLYKDRLEQLGVQIDTRIHTTRLKNRLLAAIPDLKAFVKGKDVLLIFDTGIAEILNTTTSHDNNAMDLMRAAKVVREEMLKRNYEFDGSFQENCQYNAVSPSLLALINMIINGASLQNQSDSKNQSVLTISQLIVFNSVKNLRGNETLTRHSRNQETPLPLYLAMKIHVETRSRSLIDTMFNLGLCVSYHRLLESTTNIANGVCEQFKAEDIVCPPKLRHNLFTTAAVDNIDHNPSSTTAKESFHGTGISLIQHPSITNLGTKRGLAIINQSTAPASKRVMPLPSSYTLVPPTSLKSKVFTAPCVPGPLKPQEYSSTAIAKETEKAWLRKVKMAIETSIEDDWISWSAFFADISADVISPPVINALLPLFIENAHSAAMIRHSMDIVKKAVQYLNPGQIPIIAADQPLYALAKQIQWAWPDIYGEDHFVIMFGGLHIEMVILKLLGDWLEDSGWTNILIQADIASPGTANSFIKGSHVTKTRHAHQLTAASLYILLQEAYSVECDNSEVQLTYEEWCQERAKTCVYFDYWLKTLTLELLLLRYIRALREGNFQLYVESLTLIMPWIFALDHTHYSRWLSVHIRDMTTLAEKHPDILKEFQSGNFVAHKTNNKFSAIALDQCHEQNNAFVKGVGGAIGLTNNPAALRRWMIGGPEIARMVADFENQLKNTKNSQITYLHHEQTPKVQKDFVKDVNSLVKVFKDMGNPFLELSQDLLVIDTKDIVDVKVAETVKNIETIGAKQFEDFVSQRLEQCTIPVTNPIPKNNLPLFSRPPIKNKSKQKEQLAALKNDCSLFSRLYISCQVRDGDLDTFFSHENQAAPPSLSNGGKMRTGVKADLIKCLEVECFETNTAPTVDVTIFDGAAVVQMLNPGTSTTFEEYAEQIFLPYISSHLKVNSRLDIVWDIYRPDSLKAALREKRGRGTRKRVGPTHTMPKNWKSFLCVDENKSELFSFLSQKLVHLETKEKQIYATHEREVLSTDAITDTSYMAPCSHEEADTRMFLHLADAARSGLKRAIIRTVDTDVLILAVALYHKLDLSELWIAFGAGSSFRYIAVHDLVASMDPTLCQYLPVFHAFTGCDTVSSFTGKGKKTAWETWRSFPEVNSAFEEICTMPNELSEASILLIERFVVLMYDRVSEDLTVNEARKQLFTKKSRAIEHIPPTKSALLQHLKRASYQAFIWVQSLTKAPDLPEPCNWGWTKIMGEWQPIWTTLPEAAASCSELIKCSCKKGCTGRCKCSKAALKCTALCFCAGDC